jgi:hypothetical protein
MGLCRNNRKQNTIVIVSIVTCCYKIDFAKDGIFCKEVVTEFRAYELPGNGKKMSIYVVVVALMGKWNKKAYA